MYKPGAKVPAEIIKYQIIKFHFKKAENEHSFWISKSTYFEFSPKLSKLETCFLLQNVTKFDGSAGR